MNYLDDYTNFDDPLNVRLRDQLDPGRSGGTAKHLYLGEAADLNNPMLLSPQHYPYTALGTIGVRNLNTRQEEVIHQVQNPFADPGQALSASQLILLDSDVQAEVDRALRREARYTGSRHQFNDTNNVNLQWLLDNQQSAKEFLSLPPEHRGPAHPAYAHFVALKTTNQAMYNNIHACLLWGFGGWNRYKRNADKAGKRLQAHFTNLRHGLESKQSITSARGEHMSSKVLITVASADYQIKMGKSKNGGRANGIDQIWVKRNRLTGAVLEYLIVEAKGSVNAVLGHTETGAQMSPRWVFCCLLRMTAKHGSYIDGETNPRLPRKILDALLNANRFDAIPVKGVVFQSLHKSPNESNVIEMTDMGTYNFVGAYESAKAQQPMFHNAPVTTNLFSL